MGREALLRSASKTVRSQGSPVWRTQGRRVVGQQAEELACRGRVVVGRDCVISEGLLPKQGMTRPEGLARMAGVGGHGAPVGVRVGGGSRRVPAWFL